MNKTIWNVALVCGPDCDMESQAMRATLEYFGARVFMYWIGRPSDFIDVLSGEELYPRTDVLIMNFHGDEGKFMMPELGEDVYEAGEPRGDFGPEEIIKFAKLDGKIVIGNGCTLGYEATANAFMQAGCRTYIAPNDYPDGNDALMFVIRILYEMIQHGKEVKEACAIASAQSAELTMFKLYGREEA